MDVCGPAFHDMPKFVQYLGSGDYQVGLVALYVIQNEMLKCLKQQTFEILSLLECYSRSTTLKDSFISNISSKNGWQRCRQELHKYLQQQLTL